MLWMHENLHIKENSLIAKIAAWKLGSRQVAIVIGSTIHLHNTTRSAFLSDERWVKHERCHLAQFRQFGFVNFIVKYLVESIKKGYYNNRFEVEARAAEKL